MTFEFTIPWYALIPLGIYLTWVGYLACTNLLRVWHRLSWYQKALALPLILVFWAADVAVNVVVASPLFLELPEEFLTTDRLSRHARGPKNWRWHIADWVCRVLLDIFDPTGDHC